MTARTPVTYCKCGWSTDLPDDEHNHEERMQEGRIKAATAQGWAHHEAQLRDLDR